FRMTGGCGKCCLCFLALFFPPLAVGIHMGCNSDFCLNWCLTFLFYFPGVIHAWYVILAKQPECHTVVHVHHTAPSAPPAPPSVININQTAPVYQVPMQFQAPSPAQMPYPTTSQCAPGPYQEHPAPPCYPGAEKHPTCSSESVRI
ncbi:hypothetical protein PENTCL1PPCAC_25384, partial [Pristionchus entomophagus]